MTFTPPTEYPATYKQNYATVTIHGWFDDRYIGIWRGDTTGEEGAGMWNEDGFDLDESGQLEDIPKRVVHWRNDYISDTSGAYTSREAADGTASAARIAVIRREMNEDGTDVQYFKEDV